MAFDSLRIITFSSGQRPSLVMDLNDGTTFTKVRGSFTYTPGSPNYQQSSQARQYGGSRTVGVTHSNGSATWRVYVKSTTPQLASRALENLLALVEQAASGGQKYLEWTPPGGSASYLRLSGGGTWTLEWDPNRWAQTSSVVASITFAVFPLVEWARPAVSDVFDYNDPTLSDYTWDRGVPSNFTFGTSPSSLVPTAAALTTGLHRARHIARGYTSLEGQAMHNFRVGATITGIHGGVMLRASASTYVEVYLDDNGTNSRLRVDVIIGGVTTNRASVNLGSRVAINTNHGVVGRIEGNVVYAEYTPGLPGPFNPPTVTTSYTLVNADAPLDTTPGNHGWTFTPLTTAQAVWQYEFKYVYKNLTFPRTVSPTDAIPGTAPARCDVTLTPSGGSLAPVFAMVGWAKRVTTPTLNIFQSVYPFGPLSAAGSAGAGRQVGVQFVTNMAAASDAQALSGTRQEHTVAGAEVMKVGWTVDPTAYTADQFSANELRIEVWARLAMSVNIASPTLTLSATNQDVAFGTERFSDEWGRVGRLVVPSGFWEYYRLGTLTLPADPQYRRPVVVWLTISTGSASSGFVYVDRIDIVHAWQRALSPTAKALDSAYPLFVSSTAITQKTVRSDLSAVVAGAPSFGSLVPMPDHGLGGNLIEPPPGNVDWFVKLSTDVPDSPAVATAQEQLTNTSWLGLDYTPRSYLLRST